MAAAFDAHRSPTNRWARPWVAVAVVLAVVLAASGCDPILHPSQRTVDPYGGPVSFRLLSGDGRIAVVKSTGAGGSVPGAGWWLVDRGTGAATAIPGAQDVLQISGDGQRVLFYDAGRVPTIWDQGTIRPVPVSVTMSSNLRFGVHTDFFVGQVRRWELATGATIAVEAVAPRPPDLTGATYGGYREAFGVSDDGNVVWYELKGPSRCITRFVWLDVARVEDFAFCDDPVLVAANGSSLVRLLDFVAIDQLVGLGGPSRLELVNSATHDVVALEPEAPNAIFDGVVLAPTGWNLWTVEVAFGGQFPPCGTMNTPPCTGTIASRDLISMSGVETQRFPVDPRLQNGSAKARYATNGGGRFLGYSVDAVGAPIHVVDRLTGTDEVIPVSGSGVGGVPAISDAGDVVAFTRFPHVFDYPSNWSGWDEAEADMAGGATIVGP